MEILQKYADLVIFSVLGLMAFGALYCVVERLLFYAKLARKTTPRRRILTRL